MIKKNAVLVVREKATVVAHSAGRQESQFAVEFEFLLSRSR